MITELEEILPPKMSKVPVNTLQIRIVWMKIRKEYHEVYKARKTHNSLEAISYLAKKYHYSEKRVTELIYPQTKKDQIQSPE